MDSSSESKTAQWLRKGLYLSAATFAVSILVFLAYVTLSLRPPGILLAYVSSAALFATLIFGVGRFAYVLFVELQAPLSELLITFLVAGGLMTVFRPVLKDTIDADQTGQWIALMLVVCAGVMLGSIWGWSLIKRLGERDTRQRLRLLAFGWIGMLGVAGAGVFAFLTMFWIATSISSASIAFGHEFSTIYLGHLAVMPLAIPALMVERRIKTAGTMSLNHPASATSTPPGTPNI